MPRLLITIFVVIILNSTFFIPNCFSNTSWQQIGPDGGTIRALAIDPTNPQTVYAGAAGGVYKSVNGGTSWTAVNTGLTDTQIMSLAIDPSSPQTVYAGTYYNGVFKSVNGATSWSAVNTGQTGTSVTSLAFALTMPQTLYAGTNGGIFKSIDGGGVWSAVNIGLTNTDVRSLAITPSTPQTVYAGTNGGVFKSIDGGGSWNAVNTGLTSTDVRSLAVDSSTSQTVYAGTFYGLFKSVNGGSNWSAINVELTDTIVIAIAVDPSTPQSVYVGTTSGVFKSVDGGGIWSAVNTGLIITDATSLVIDPSSPQRVYAGTNGGVFKSVDGGGNWGAVNTGLASTNVRSIAVAPSTSQTLYAGTNGGILKSVDGGGNWIAANIGLTNTDVRSLAIDSTTPQTVYAGTYRNLFKSINGGTSWSAVSGGLPSTVVQSVAINPSTPQTVYVGTTSGVFKSVDDGGNWSAANTGLTNTDVRTVVIDPTTPQVVYAGSNGGVFKSTDSGVNWSAVNVGLTNTSVYSFAIAPDRPQTVYAGTWGGVFKSVNGGTDWSAANTGLTDPRIQSLALDPSSPQTIYAASYEHGIYKTVNAGESWSQVNGGLTSTNVQSLAIDPTTTQTVYAGTAYGGVFKSTNGGLNTFTVTSDFKANGRISPSTQQTVNNGSTVSFTISPNSGYSVDTPIGGTCPQGTFNPELTTNNYTTGIITFNCTVAPTFTITPPDISKPIVTLTSQPMNYSNQASGTIAFSANEAATFECKMDGGAYTPCTSPFSYSTAANSQHTFTVQATNSANKASTPVSFTWTINSTLVENSAVIPPQTGQTTCYDVSGATIVCNGTGQDGEIQAGRAWSNPRFVDNGDQTLIDKLTGLIWTKDANLMNTRDPAFDSVGTAQDGRVTWQDALNYIKKLNEENYLGYNDWRLPNINELFSLVNVEQVNSATWLNSQGFINCQQNISYFSSTTYVGLNNGAAWSAIFSNGGGSGSNFKSNYLFVWPVRSGQSGLALLAKTGQTSCYDTSDLNIPCVGTGQDGETQTGAFWPSQRFRDNGDESISDSLTGLVWSKNGHAPGPSVCGPSIGKTWQEAFDYVNCLNTNHYLGKNDWRLPNNLELQSLQNKGQADSAAWLVFAGFADVQSSNYWTSNTYSQGTFNAWIVNMWWNNVPFDSKNSTLNVWPVRSGFFSKTVVPAIDNKPVINEFSIPATGTSPIVPVYTFTATDDVAVIGYLLAENDTTPATSATDWSVPTPTSYTFIGIPDGIATAKSLYVWTKDAAGNISSSKSANIIITLPDVTKPVITAFTLPATGTNLTVTVSTFTASDNADVIAYCLTETNNSIGCSWSNTAPVNYTFAMEGAKSLYAWAKDSVGNISNSLSATVTVDMTGPTTNISSLANAAITNNATLNISGTVSDTNGVANLKINNTDVIINTGNFSHAVTLQAGSNSIITVATDTFGNSTTDKRTIILDQTAPTLTVLTPADNSKTALSLANITGTIDETSTVTVKINSSLPQNASIIENRFSADVTLATGLNSITITATDLAGNTTSVVRSIIYDNTKPSLSILNPSQDISTTQSSITISGTFSDAVTTATISITTDGQTFTPNVTADGNFSQMINLSTDKTYSVVVTATDQVGNTTTSQRNIIKTTIIATGDINGDGKVDIADALKALRFAVGLDTSTSALRLVADVAPLSGGIPAPDGVIDIADALVILEKSVGLVSW